MKYYGILEKPKTPAGEIRALFFRQAFGGSVVPLLDDSATMLTFTNETEARPYYRADVLGKGLGQFVETCAIRPGGQQTLRMVQELGFFPVNVEGITLVSSEVDLFKR